MLFCFNKRLGQSWFITGYTCPIQLTCLLVIHSSAILIIYINYIICCFTEFITFVLYITDVNQYCLHTPLFYTLMGLLTCHLLHDTMISRNVGWSVRYALLYQTVANDVVWYMLGYYDAGLYCRSGLHNSLTSAGQLNVPLGNVTSTIFCNSSFVQGYTLVSNNVWDYQYRTRRT